MTWPTVRVSFAGSSVTTGGAIAPRHPVAGNFPNLVNTMKQVILPIQELEAIAATRFMFGVGAALLLGHLIAPRCRRPLGWALTAIGVLSTPPLIFDVYANREQH